MKHLKTYKIFKEEVDFNINPTDDPSVNMAKEKMNLYKKQLVEFKSKKSQLDNIYLKTENEKELQSKIEQLIGNQENKNPFLVEYSSISSFKRKTEKTQKTITEDKIKADDFNSELNLATDDSIKSKLKTKILEIKQKILDNQKKISELSKNISEGEKKLNDKILEIEKNIKENIEKITSDNEK
jgi:hypothetical protein